MPFAVYSGGISKAIDTQNSCQYLTVTVAELDQYVYSEGLESVVALAVTSANLLDRHYRVYQLSLFEFGSQHTHAVEWYSHIRCFRVPFLHITIEILGVLCVRIDSEFV